MTEKIKVVVIPGDGIGPEVIAATLEVLKATGLDFEWIDAYAGMTALEAYGDPLPRETLAKLSENLLAIKGPTRTPQSGGYRSVNVALRQHFNLEVNLRPIKHWEGAPSILPDLNVVIVRQNTEDLYVGNERYVSDTHDAAEAIALVSKGASRRIFQFAFEYARKNGCHRITAIHKANILKLIYGEMFPEVGREIAKEYPEIQFRDLIVDNANFQLVNKPREFDVMVTPNVFGDIFSDLCAGLANGTAGLGLCPGANIGHNRAIFEACHGTSDDIAGKGIANPSALILSGAMMLDYIGKTTEAERIRRAVGEVIREGRFVTADLKPRVYPPVGTALMTAEIIRKMNEI